jgi:hypothetical protein
MVGVPRAASSRNGETAATTQPASETNYAIALDSWRKIASLTSRIPPFLQRETLLSGLSTSVMSLSRRSQGLGRSAKTVRERQLLEKTEPHGGGRIRAGQKGRYYPQFQENNPQKRNAGLLSKTHGLLAKDRPTDRQTE